MWGLREELVPLKMLIIEQELILSKNPPPFQYWFPMVQDCVWIDYNSDTPCWH